MKRRAVLMAVAVIGLSALTVTFWVARQHQIERAEQEVRRNTYALCVSINSGREIARTNSVVLYGELADKLRYHKKEMGPKERAATKRRLKLAGKNLDATRPLDCNTYALPDLPPDSGVH